MSSCSIKEVFRFKGVDPAQVTGLSQVNDPEAISPATGQPRRQVLQVYFRLPDQEPNCRGRAIAIYDTSPAEVLEVLPDPQKVEVNRQYSMP